MYDPSLLSFAQSPVLTSERKMGAVLLCVAGMGTLLVAAATSLAPFSTTTLLTQPASQSRVVPITRTASPSFASSGLPVLEVDPTPASNTAPMLPLAPASSGSRLGSAMTGMTFMAAFLVGAVAQRRMAMAAASGKTTPGGEEDEGLLLGVGGVVANVVMGVSLVKLFNTGCGLPPGPLGLYGLAEGLSYLAVPGLVAYSAYTKVKTGSGLPAGKFGLVGLAEGLSYLTIVAGAVVLGNQIFNFGFIPNVVPVEGGICA
jgi:hypothetical protein